MPNFLLSHWVWVLAFFFFLIHTVSCLFLLIHSFCFSHSCCAFPFCLSASCFPHISLFFFSPPLACFFSLIWLMQISPATLNFFSSCVLFPSVHVPHPCCGDTLTLHCSAYQSGMLLIHARPVLPKCQLNRSYSCVCCACASVIITIAVTSLEREARWLMFSHTQRRCPSTCTEAVFSHR